MIGQLSLKDILAPAHVHRWHMIRVKRTQTLAEHAFTVALLAAKLVSLLEQPSFIDHGNLLATALTHDMPEIEHGDMPTPAKWFIQGRPGGKQILWDMTASFWEDRGVEMPLAYSEEIHHLVKLADRVEAYLFYREEGDDPAIKDRLRAEAQAMADNHFHSQDRLMTFIRELP